MTKPKTIKQNTKMTEPKEQKATSEILKESHEVLHDSSSDMNAQMLSFMSRVDNRLKQIETQVNKIDEVKSSIKEINRKISSLEITVGDLKKKNTELESSTQAMSDMFDSVKTSCESNKKDIDKIKTDMGKLSESIEAQSDSDVRTEIDTMKDMITDLQCRSMKNNLIFTGLLESPYEDTESKLREFIYTELGIDDTIEFGNVHRFGNRRFYNDNKPRPIVARFLYRKQLEFVLKNAYKLRGTVWSIREQFPEVIEERRRELYPVARESRQRGQRTKMVRDKLFIDNKLYDPSEDRKGPVRQYSDAARETPSRQSSKRRRVPSTPSVQGY